MQVSVLPRMRVVAAPRDVIGASAQRRRTIPTPAPSCDSAFNPDLRPERYQPYLCGNGTYNMEATLIFTTGHDGIKAFFHDDGYFSYPALVLYGCLYFVFAVVTYGIAVPSGLFVPCILTGAAFGASLRP